MSRHGTASRYVAGCRCDACKIAKRLHQRKMRDNNPATARDNSAVQARVRSMCVQWIKANDPRLYAQFLALAKDELGVEPRPMGRPRKVAAS